MREHKQNCSCSFCRAKRGEVIHKWTFEQRLAQSERMKGDKNPMRRIPGLAQRVAQKIRERGSLAGDNNPSRREAVRRKKSESLKKWWQENRNSVTVLLRNKKLSEIMKGRPRPKEACMKVSRTYHNKSEEEKRRLAEEHSKKMKALYQTERGFRLRKQHSERLRGENGPNWKGGSSRLPYSFDFSPALKRKIFERDNFSCQICGTNRDLVVHHINYNKQDCSNSNLITLCRRHNSKANFDRSKWEFLFTVLMEMKSEKNY